MPDFYFAESEILKLVVKKIEISAKERGGGILIFQNVYFYETLLCVN